MGYRGEVWALALDPSQRRLVTGSADVDLQVYEVVSHEAAEQEAAGSAQYDTLKSLGVLRIQLSSCTELQSQCACTKQLLQLV